MEALDLQVGDWVEVRSREEILATLDADGRYDGMPFMPEMLRFCGQRLQVFRSAHKTCDTITKTGGRRLERTVHLNTRCSGSAHGGCQAACLLFWKDAWIKPVGAPAIVPPAPATTYTVQQLDAATQVPGSEPARFRCQATELVRASRPLAWWDLRQYWRDWRSRNMRLGPMLRVFAIALRNTIQRWRGGGRYPGFADSTLTKTPSEHLGLMPGELVQVKPLAEIVKTLDTRRRNRGLWFDTEMIPFCGGTYRVRGRVEQIINERTGEMMRLPNDCVILENVWCKAEYSDRRLFCPRSIYPYWREIWLRRVPAATPAPVTSVQTPSQTDALV